MPHFYGFASNKLGEACTCWLGRWGVDILNIELSLPSLPAVRIWTHRGLPASFVRAVLSADTFFVKDEMERYTFARKVLDLRRKGWEVEMEGQGDLSMSESIAETEGEGWDLWEEDEEELAKVFADGVYYTHMVGRITIAGTQAHLRLSKTCPQLRQTSTPPLRCRLHPYLYCKQRTGRRQTCAIKLWRRQALNRQNWGSAPPCRPSLRPIRDEGELRLDLESPAHLPVQSPFPSLKKQPDRIVTISSLSTILIAWVLAVSSF